MTNAVIPDHESRTCRVALLLPLTRKFVLKSTRDIIGEIALPFEKEQIASALPSSLPTVAEKKNDSRRKLPPFILSRL